MRFQSDNQRKAMFAQMRGAVRSVAFRKKAAFYEGERKGRPVLRGIGAGLIGSQIAHSVATRVNKKMLGQLGEELFQDIATKGPNAFNRSVITKIGVRSIPAAVAALGTTSVFTRFVTRRETQGKGRFKTPQEARSYRRVAAGMAFGGPVGALIGGISARRRNKAELAYRRR